MKEMFILLIAAAAGLATFTAALRKYGSDCIP